MSAVVESEGSRKYLAWCEQCQDGVRHGSPSRAEEWASKHNEQKHKREGEDG